MNARAHDFAGGGARRGRCGRDFHPGALPASVDLHDQAGWPPHLRRFRRAQLALLGICGFRDTPAGRFGVQPFDLHQPPSRLAGQVIVYPYGDSSVRVRIGVAGGVACEPRRERVEPATVVRAETAASPLHWLRAWAVDRAQWFARVGPYAGLRPDAERIEDFPLILIVAGPAPACRRAL